SSRHVVAVDASASTGSILVTNAPALQQRFQLTIRPIIKSTVGQRKSLGDTLDDVDQAVKLDGAWSVIPPSVTKWNKVMQFERRHTVDSGKAQQAWNNCLVLERGETITFVVYEYGMSIPT
ncbi:hypothetical protein GN958_ATG01707, partial [Phytophthora infestans]